MTQTKLVQDLVTVTRFETMRSVGSVRGLLVLSLYIAGSALSALFYVKAVHALETKAIEFLSKSGQPAPDDAASKPAGSILAYPELAKAAAGGDEAKAELWSSTPPVVLVSFSLALFFLPFFLMLAAHDVLARDNELRTLRYLRPRTSATAWVLGKFLAQMLLIALGTVLAGIVVFLIAATSVEGFDAGMTMLGFARFWWRIFVFEMGFLGLIFVVSVAMRTSFTALLATGFALFSLWLFSWFDALEPISPFTYWRGLLNPWSKELVTSLAVYAALALAGVGISIAWLQRKEI